MKFIFLFSSLLLIAACNKHAHENIAIVKVNKIPEEGIIIDKWQIIGPIPVKENDRDTCMEVDQLKLLGLEEGNLDFKDFINIPIQDSTNENLNEEFQNKLVITGKIPLEIVDNKYKEFENLQGMFYAACLIKSKKDFETMLHLGSSTMNRVWLNNELISANDYAINAWSYQNYISVNLKKGDNLLLVKVHKPEKSWELYARLENFTERGFRRHFESRNHRFIKNSVLNGYSTLELDPIFPPCNGVLTISDNEGVKLTDSLSKEKTWSCDLNFLPDGFYQAQLSTGNVRLEQGFYKGNLEDTTRRLFNSIQSIPKPDQINRNINALAYRFNHLLKQSWIDWKKIVQIYIELSKTYNLLIDNKNPFQHISGCFIRSYISKIDDSEQFYILHVPSTYNSKTPLPVMLIIPTNGMNLPYLESYRVANYVLINVFQDLAEKYNMIIIEPGSRHFDQVINNTIEESEMFHILNDVKADYSLDLSRLYLSTACSGGNDALKLAVKYPDRFAAIGLISPSLSYSYDGTNPWLQYSRPVNFLENISNVPILNIHSEIDRHVPFEVSLIFSRLAKKADMKNFRFMPLPNEFQYYYTDQVFEDVFDFCSRYSLNTSPSEVVFETSLMLYNKSFWITLDEITPSEKARIQARIKANKLSIKKENIQSYSIDLSTLPYDKGKELKIIDNGKVVYEGIPNDGFIRIGEQEKLRSFHKNNQIAGPFSHVFDKKFVVVMGTSGSTAETEAITAMADTINKYWEKRFFTKCVIKSDIEINEQDISEANLILLGSFESNSILEKIEPEIPLTISPQYVRICDAEVKGTSLGFYMIYPNPMNKNRYVALISYNNPEAITLGYETNSFNDITDYGWFDYKIWEADNPGMRLISGYFGPNWLQ